MASAHKTLGTPCLTGIGTIYYSSVFLNIRKNITTSLYLGRIGGMGILNKLLNGAVTQTTIAFRPEDQQLAEHIRLTILQTLKPLPSGGFYVHVDLVPAESLEHENGSTEIIKTGEVHIFHRMSSGLLKKARIERTVMRITKNQQTLSGPLVVGDVQIKKVKTSKKSVEPEFNPWK